MEELEVPFIVTLKEKKEGVPHRWQLYQVEAPSGRLDRHLFGPFSTVKYFGPFPEIEYLDDDSKTGVASCNSSAIWTKAAALIGRVCRYDGEKRRERGTYAINGIITRWRYWQEAAGIGGGI
jgi:hypothetical protein